MIRILVRTHTDEKTVLPALGYLGLENILTTRHRLAVRMELCELNIKPILSLLAKPKFIIKSRGVATPVRVASGSF